MKIAVIGSGISGMTAAYYLSENHEVTLFEAGDRLGGHTATIDVEEGEKTIPVDTGFIVFNDWTYPNFIELLDELGVDSQPTQMSFSVSDKQSGIEYAGTNLNTLFGRRKNLFSIKHLKMLKEIVTFNKQVEGHLAQMQDDNQLTLGQYLETYTYSEAFKNLYIVPMGSAIWSAKQSDMLKMPLSFFVKFFRNHGLLNLKERPQWRVIKGGSSAYIEPLIAPYKDRIRLNTAVYEVDRNITGSYVTLKTKEGEEAFDHVIFSCHSNQALACLNDVNKLEKEILQSIPYSNNEVVLHTDKGVLPKTKRCWSSWNVSLGDQNEIPCLSYNMNILQGIDSDQTYCVTLNQSDCIDPQKVIGVYNYEHPVFTTESVEAQSRWGEINGKRNTWFCGAYWRNGFHEDGVWSARRVSDTLEQVAVKSTLSAA
ncbi:MAG: FAD-dependent oxidoreductase [Gammaproteobacteria bacterium]|nr:FAD-dependent oxidoreductase [Gammaproteobacteria bacterium]